MGEENSLLVKHLPKGKVIYPDKDWMDSLDWKQELGDCD